MPPITRIIVCGSSLYMASLEAGLRANPGFDVTRIPAILPGISEALRAARAEVIAFDLAELPVDLPVTVLREHPHLLLLGMDPTSQDLLVLSGHQASALSVADLVGIIAGRACADAGPVQAPE
jgi:hypothetical protein